MATTTPNFGWPVPTSTDYVKDGATAIEALGDAIDATVFGLGASALTLITSQTISSSVSAVNFDNCFTSTYQNYLIVLNVTVSGLTNITFKYRTSGSSISTDYTNGSLAATTSASVGNYAGGETTAAFLGRTEASKKFVCSINVMNPLQTGSKQQFYTGVGDTSYYAGGGYNTNAGSMDGFSIIGFSNNLTAGTIRVYGLKN
jgi:hypothetical protein